jgi:hypothetical protein
MFFIYKRQPVSQAGRHGFDPRLPLDDKLNSEGRFISQLARSKSNQLLASHPLNKRVVTFIPSRNVFLVRQNLALRMST